MYIIYLIFAFNKFSVTTDLLEKAHTVFVFFVLIIGVIIVHIGEQIWKRKTRDRELKMTPSQLQALREELQQMFASFKTEITCLTQEQVQQAASGIASGVNVSMERLIKQYDCSVQAKFGNTHKAMDALDKRTESLEQSNKNLFQQCDQLSRDMQRLQSALEIAESDVPIVTADPNWDRATDGTIIRIRAEEPIPKCAALQALDAWLSEYKGKFICNNDDSKDSKSFVLKFTGPSGLAKTRVSKALASLRGQDGNWMAFEAKITEVSSAGGDSGSARVVRLSPGPDKSPKQVAREIAAKHLRNLLQQAVPRKRFFFNKTDGKISCDWIPIARVEPAEDKPVSIEWNNSSPLIGEIDKKDIVSRFCDSGRVPVQESWAI